MTRLRLEQTGIGITVPKCKPELSTPWSTIVEKRLTSAEGHLNKWDLAMAWDCIHSAQRIILQYSGSYDLISFEKIAIQEEIKFEKISGWRAESIKKLLDVESCCGNENLTRLVEAIRLRDEFLQNSWYKIYLRRRHLFALSLIIWATIGCIFILSCLRALPPPYNEISLVSGAVLFGIIGASVSVAQSLVNETRSAAVKDRIPMQQLNSFVIWARPGVGASVALTVPALAKVASVSNLLGGAFGNTYAILGLCFLAGYSEKFVLRLIGDTAKPLESKSRPSEM